MANENNLIPQNKRTKSEQREIAKLGGKKSRCFKAKKEIYKRAVGNSDAIKFN